MAKKNKNQMVASEELVSNAPLKDADLSSKNVSAKAKDSKEFKNKKDIYCYLNTNCNSYNRMLSRLRGKVLINHYQINKANFDIKISNMELIWDNSSKRGSNINEFFEVINW